MSLSETLSALSDKNRRHILDTLKKGEIPVSEIAKKMYVTLPTISHHLDVLKRAGLISGRREGQQIIYSINLSVVEEVGEKIMAFLKK